MTGRPRLHLVAGGLCAELHPAIGGSLGGFWPQAPEGPVDWMRRASSQAIADCDVRGHAR